MKATLPIVGALVSTVGARPMLAPLDGYAVVPLTWYGINATDGSEIVINGTVQEIHSQVRSIDNSFNWTMPPTQQSIKPRNKGKVICNVGGSGGANNDYVQEGIDYLKAIAGGLCGARPGPFVCTRISCSYGAGIWYCNDTPNEIHHNCSDLATYVEDIREHCHTEGAVMYVRGQEFDTNNFNIIVGSDKC